MGKYRLQIHIAKPGPFPASALNVRRNGEKRFLILADGDQAISELRRSIQEQYAKLYENEADFTAVQLTNKDCYELDDNYKIRDVFDPLDTVRVVGHQDTPTPKPSAHNLLKRKVDKGPAAAAAFSYPDADSRSTSSTPAPESGIEGESKKQRKKRRKAEEAAAKAAAAVASSGLFANGAIEPSEDFVTEDDHHTFAADPSDSTTSSATSTMADSSKGKAVVDKGAINMDTTGSHKAEQEKAAEEKAKLQKQAEEVARKEVEEKKRKVEEAKRQKQEQKAKKEAEDKAKKEVEDKARKEAEDKARKEAEDKARKAAEDKARKEAEGKARKEAEDKARKEAEDKARKEAEDKAKKEAEDKARKEAEDKAKKEAEDKARREAEEKAKALAAEEEKKRRQEEKAQKEAEKAKAAEEKARKAAEAKEAKRKAAEETKARLAEEKARKAAELKEAKRVVAEEKKQKLAEERAAKLKETNNRRASQSEHATGSDAEVDQLLSSPEPTELAPSEDASGISVSPLKSETPTANQVHNEDSESSTTTPELEERPRRKSMVVIEIAQRTAPSTSGTVNRLAPGTVPDFLTNAAENEEASSAKAVSDESPFTTATEHPLSPKKRGRPPKAKPEAAVPVSPVKPTSTISTSTKPVESNAPLADTASDPESEQELEVFSFFKEQRLRGQQPPPVINTPKPVSSAFSFEPYHSTPPQRLTDKPTMASDSDSDSDASGPDYDAPPSMPPMILSSRPSISVPRLRPESPRGLAISMPKVSPSKPISSVASRREETYDSREDAYDNGVLTEEEEDEPLVRTRKVVLPGVPKPMALVKEEAKDNEDDDAATKEEKDELQETSEESGQSDHNNSSDDDSTSSDSESESESDSESEESGSGMGSRSSEDQEAVLVKTEPLTNGSRGGGGILSGLLSLQGAGHGSNNNSSKPTVPARTSFFSLTDISAKMGLPVTSLAELTAQGRAKKIGSIGSAIASPASSASSGRKAMGGMNGKGAGSSSDGSSDDEAESDSDSNTDSSDEEGDAAKKTKAGPQIKIAGKKRRSSTKSASGGSSGRKKGRLDALF